MSVNALFVALLPRFRKQDAIWAIFGAVDLLVMLPGHYLIGPVGLDVPDILLVDI